MTLEDLPGVLEIEERSFPTPWSDSSFRHELFENPYASLFVIKSPDRMRVLGFACVWVLDEEMKVNNLAIHPESRGRGLGTRLLRFLIEFGAQQGCREVTLEVRPSNLAAIRLYRKAGLVAVGRRKQYYSDTHEDAIVMARPIVPRRG
jgi:ribosomal-protein-alanine N-acetyltransferase